MQTINDVHQQFAEFFRSDELKPFAYLVSKRLAEGNICVDLDKLEPTAEELLYLERFGWPLSKQHLYSVPFVSVPGGDRQPFVLHHERLYLQRYFAYETGIVESIKNLVHREDASRKERTESLLAHRGFIASLSAGDAGDDLSDEERVDWQQVAAVLGAINNFTIITGGPGTGKTTTVAKLLTILYTLQPSLKPALAAPTGKAAVRLAESLKASATHLSDSMKDKLSNLKPTTIHRLLKPIPDSPYFRHDSSNPLVYDIVIVDEASMIDVALFAKLLSAIGPGTRIILLGDRDQLASVEAGSLLGDLCQVQQRMNALPSVTIGLVNQFIPALKRQVSQAYRQSELQVLSGHIIELKRSHRFSGSGGIGRFSKAIISNETGQIDSFIAHAGDGRVVVDTGYSDGLFDKFISGYAAYIQENDIAEALNKLNGLRVLCAVREGPHGLNAVNRKIESWLSANGLISNTAEFYAHRPVIITRNYPELNLFNGDVGIIRRDTSGVLKAWFEDSEKNLKSVLPGFIPAVETVFAMTIHKSQGSEYARVMVVLPAAADQPLLTRELLYTAVTRAKDFVLLQASREVIYYTAGRSVQRASGIMDRF